MKPKKVILLAVLAIINSIVFAQNAPLSKLRVNGFGDFTLGHVFGKYAKPEEKELFNQFGIASHPLNQNSGGFGIVGNDFVLTTDIAENIVFQTEVNLQVGRGETSDMELDVERAYLDYTITDNSGVQVGLFFTPIGFSNRNLYARAWLMNSVNIRQIVEEEYNIIPTHTVGLSYYNSIPIKSTSLQTIFSAGNGRAATPADLYYNRNDESFSFTGLLEWNIPKGDDFRVGLSGYYTTPFQTVFIDSLGKSVNYDDGINLQMEEWGINPYVWYRGKRMNLFVEYHAGRMRDDNMVSGAHKYIVESISSELSFNLKVKKKKLIPYVRFDKFDFNEGNPYLGLRADGDLFTRHYIEHTTALMFGMAFDYKPFNRFKIEYMNNIDGVRKIHGITLQTAYSF